MSGRVTVVGFVGPSGTGKTTLLEQVVAELRTRGRSVGVVKRSSHRVEVDRPGKDSHRLYESGADGVVLASPAQLVAFERRETIPPSLDDCLRALPAGIEIALVEGFHETPIPRYVVLPDPDAARDRYVGHGRVLRVIEARRPDPQGPPVYDPSLARELADEIESQALAGRTAGSAAAS